MTDTIELDDKTYQGVCDQNPEALGEVATLLKKRGHHGWRRLTKSGGYSRLKAVSCELEI